MYTKTKNQTTTEKVAEASKQAGILLMTAAATIGFLDLPNQPDKRVVLPIRPTFAFAENNIEPEANNPIRREREETAPHYVSYSVSQRTVARSGKK